MKCGIIKDLLPSYIDELTSEDSNQAIEKHLKICDECQRYYKSMRPERTSLSEEFVDFTDEKIESAGVYHKVDTNEIQVLKSFRRKRGSLIALLCACLAAIVALVVIISLGIVTMTIPYEKAQPQVEISEQTAVETYYVGSEEHNYYWHGIKTDYKVAMLNHFGENHEVHQLTINDEEKLVILISGHTTVKEYLKNKEVLGDEDLAEHTGSTWGGNNEIFDFNEVDLVYYLDKNVERTKSMSEEEVLAWIEEYGHLVWNKASE